MVAPRPLRVTAATLPERRGAPPQGAEIKLVEPDAVRTDEGSAMNIASVLARLRATTPLVHCLTNTVVPQITANVLLAAGAAPALPAVPHVSRL